VDARPYIDAWRARWAAAAEADRTAERAAWDTARALAAILRDRFGATRVILIGSLAEGRFRTDSDLDLAVAGVADDRFFRAGAELEAAAGRPVDLIPLESASAALLAEVGRAGIILHDQTAA
jgi:predicted nucleotidyltransferase